MAHHQLGRVARLARVAVVARAILLPLAKEALATADREGDDDALPLLQCRTGAGFDDIPHELVPDDIACAHTGDIAVVEMEVRTADRGRGDTQDRIARIDDFGIGDGRSEEHTSELQSLMRISYAVFCLKKKK